jgi:antitoxin YefM
MKHRLEPVGAEQRNETVARYGDFRLQFWFMSTVPLSEAKARLSEIADEVKRTHERVHITRNGREYVVLVAAEDLESIEATLELLTDPQAQERIRRSEAEFTRGDVLDEAQVRALVADRSRTRPR